MEIILSLLGLSQLPYYSCTPKPYSQRAVGMPRESESTWVCWGEGETRSFAPPPEPWISIGVRNQVKGIFS